MTEELEIKPTLEIIFNPACTPERWDAINRLERYMLTRPREFGDLTEIGTPGIYSRTLKMPTGMMCTSMIHKSHHQFIISEGCVTVYNTLDDLTIFFKAGDHGVTLPGTRRVLFVHDACTWTTFHATDKIKEGFELLSKSEQQSIFDEVFMDICQNANNPLIVNFDEGVFI